MRESRVFGVRPIAGSVFVAVGFWLLAFAMVQGVQRLQLAANWAEAGQLVAALIAFWVARRLGAVIAEYVLAAVVAFILAEFVVHLFYGSSAVQGGPTHVAVFAAALVGVVAGTTVARARPNQQAT